VGDHDLYAMLADAAAQQRDAEALRRYASLAEETAARYNHRLYQAIAHRAWGVLHTLVGEYVAAETRLSQAMAFFEALDTRWQIGRTHLELGELARASSTDASARSHFNRAFVEFETIGAAPDAKGISTIIDQLS